MGEIDYIKKSRLYDMLKEYTRAKVLRDRVGKGACDDVMFLCLESRLRGACDVLGCDYKLFSRDGDIHSYIVYNDKVILEIENCIW